MFVWLKRLFVTPWEVQECGCRFRVHTFRPIEFKHCEKHEKEFREWLAKQPRIPAPETDPNIYFCG
jgi:hypothetical protein